MDAANLAARMAEPWFDPAGLLVAEDARACSASTGPSSTTRELGEVYVVGVAPGAQGRGLGRVLTLAGLHHLAGAGVDEVLLYVESDNAPAVAVYSRLGFTHADADTHVMYRRRPLVSRDDLPWSSRSRRPSSAQRAARAGRPRGRRGPPARPACRRPSSAASTGTLRLTSASAIGPSSWWRARRADEADRRVRRGSTVGAAGRAAGSRSRRGAAASAAAAGGRACARARRSPGRGSSPCRGAPPGRSSRPRWGSCGGRCRGRSRGSPRAIRSASKAQRPQAGPAASAYASSRSRGHEVVAAQPRSSTSPGRHATARSVDDARPRRAS